MWRYVLNVVARDCALAALLAGLATAQILDQQIEEVVYPNHGGCTYFSPGRAGQFGLSAAEDMQAMAKRAKATRSVMSTIPRPRSAALPFRAKSSDTPVAGGTLAACSGIDDCVQRAAQAAGIPMGQLTTDAEFLRRVRLDLTGRIPTREEVVRFLADTSPDKRRALVDSLLATPEWADRWAIFLGDLFRNKQFGRAGNSYHTRDALHLYLRDSLRINKAYDQLARELLAAEGVNDGRTYPSAYTDSVKFKAVFADLESNPVQASPVGFMVNARTPGGPMQDTYDTLAYVTARDFLGIADMDCVLCHDGEGRLDSLSAWGSHATRLDAWGLSAFFSELPPGRSWRKRVKAPNGRNVPLKYFTVRDRQSDLGADGRQGYYIALTKGGNRPDRVHEERLVTPVYPFAQSQVSPYLRLREQIGLYVTGDPQFARAAVNYIWREFFARGIVEPPDQFDVSRLDPANLPAGEWGIQPSHPALLEWLAKEFAKNGFDLRWLMGEIVTSQTYQLSSRYEGVFNPQYEQYFVRHQATRLSAEEIHDAILIATGQRAQYNISPTLRGLQFAMQFPTVINVPKERARHGRGARELMQSFLPGDRQETKRSSTSSPLQALNLMNNPFVDISIDNAAKSSDKKLLRPLDGTLFVLQAETQDVEAIVTGLYLTALGRYPVNQELATAVEHIGEKNTGMRYKDLLWALCNRAEFYTNY